MFVSNVIVSFLLTLSKYGVSDHRQGMGGLKRPSPIHIIVTHPCLGRCFVAVFGGIAQVLRGCFKGISRVLLEGFKCIGVVLQGGFMMFLSKIVYFCALKSIQLCM